MSAEWPTDAEREQRRIDGSRYRNLCKKAQNDESIHAELVELFAFAKKLNLSIATVRKDIHAIGHSDLPTAFDKLMNEVRNTQLSTWQSEKHNYENADEATQQQRLDALELEALAVALGRMG